MCGLTGYFYFKNKAENSNKSIIDMIRLQKHRGPDDSGIVALNTFKNNSLICSTENYETYTENYNAFLGFNRLSILDLSQNGHQPMQSSDKTIQMMMNGEIYNAFDYKQILIEKGYKFKSNTDTEIVLYLYIEFGFKKMINMLNGMFAIIIHDFNKNAIFLCRDRFGIKPLYLFKKDNFLAFSSEIKSFIALPEIKLELNENNLDEFILFRNNINETLFKNIKNIIPGNYHVFNNKTGEESVFTYFNINSYRSTNEWDSKSIPSIKEKLEESVKSQLLSDVKVGTQLSGGIDSSLVTYFANKNSIENKLETISITFSNKYFSEETYINYVSEKLKLVSHKYELNSNDYFNILNKATWHFEHPLNHPNSIGIYLLSKEAKKHVTVLLSGEGADELLAGYPSFISNLKNPYFNKQLYSKLYNHPNEFIETVKLSMHYDNRLIMSHAFGSISEKKQFFRNFNINKATENRRIILSKINDININKQRKYEIQTYLPDLLMRQDKMSMAHSIENRVPFLDNILVDFSMLLTDKELTNNYTITKWPLKSISNEIFGNKFTNRPKQGFAIPLKDFFKSVEFKDFWNNELKNSDANKYFDKNIINKWMANIDNINYSKIEELWIITTFFCFYNRFFESKLINNFKENETSNS